MSLTLILSDTQRELTLPYPSPSATLQTALFEPLSSAPYLFSPTLRLLHKGRSLNLISSSTLDDAGLSPGDIIVVLNHQTTPNPLHMRLTGEDSAL